eukprot:m.86420 g.86420  ORF g.86420 m.86420 type:complete len:214 (+) comp8432_c0_seq2:929-1570(+)
MSQLLSINEETPLMGSSDGEADADEPVFVDAYMTHEEKLKALLAAIDSSMAALRQVVNDDNLLPPPVHPTRLPKLSPYIVARLLPLTILWQVLNILILTLLDVKIQDISEIRHPTDNNAFLSGVRGGAMAAAEKALLIKRNLLTDTGRYYGRLSVSASDSDCGVHHQAHKAAAPPHGLGRVSPPVVCVDHSALCGHLHAAAPSRHAVVARHHQ